MQKQSYFREVLDLYEAAAFLRVNSKTLNTYARAGRIPGSKIGSRWRFLKSQLEQWLRDGGTIAPENTSERGGGKQCGC